MTDLIARLRALADALEPMARAPRFEDFDVPAFCAWLRAQAEAEPVGWLHHVYLGDDLVDKAMLDTADPAQVPLGPNEVVRTVVPIFLHPVPQPQPKKCGCRSCLTPAELLCTFVVCPECGDKRCPRADDHRNACVAPQPQSTEAQIEAAAKWLDHHLPPEIPACSNRNALAVGVLRAALAAKESK